MKWQDFYFEWLVKIGFYDWFNATMVEYKTPYPVGSRQNIGTVGFGGEGEPSIQDVPNVPTYQHPAQAKIDSDLDNTLPLNGLNTTTRRGGGGTGLFTTMVAQYFRSSEFSEGQANTLRYWGYQPQGQTFSAPSNFYRGYSYYSNAMKQKKELRGSGGNVLIKGSKKQWFTDKKNRTYPSLRLKQTVPMVGIRHTDYSHYGDVGNLMEIAWGSMNGLSYTYNELGNSENYPELDALEEQFMTQITNNEENRGLMSEATRQEALSRGRRPGLGGLRAEADYIRGGSTNLLLDDDITLEVNEIRSNLENSEEINAVNQITEFIHERYKNNKGVIARNKKFREVDYVKDKIRHDCRQQINNLLLGIDADMSVTTAEVILQILGNPAIGINRQGELSGGPIQSIINTQIDLIIPRDTQIKIQELLLMHGPVEIYGNDGQNAMTSIKSKTRIGSFYLDIPMNKLQFAVPTQSQSQYYRFGWSWNGLVKSVDVQKKLIPIMMRGSIGDEELFANQNTVGVAQAMTSMWQDLQIVDDLLMPLINAISEYLPEIENSNYNLDFYGRMDWLYSLPTWINPSYALMVADNEIQNSNSIDWLPKDVGFRINGQDEYMYGVKLRDWVENYKNFEPQTTNQKYWNISVMFNQPVTKKSRGATEREIIEQHQIILNLQPVNSVQGQLGMNCVNQIVTNNLGMVESDISPENWMGMISEGDLPGMTYEFFNDVVEWPLQLELPGFKKMKLQGKQGLGQMQSYLTPMDNDTEWWNQFLDNETGILSLSAPTANAQAPPPINSVDVLNGWSIGWDFGYMDSIIQRAKSEGKPWATELTLESYCKKVYPSERIDAIFHPKMEYYDTEDNDGVRAMYYGLKTPTANIANFNVFNMAGNNATTEKYLTFLPFESRNYSGGSGGATNPYRVRFNRRNEFGGVPHRISENGLRLLARYSNPMLGWQDSEPWLQYIENDEGYTPVNQSARFEPRAKIQPVDNSSVRNNRLQGISEAGGVQLFDSNITNFKNGFQIMEQENGNLVSIPTFNPVVKSWNDMSWEELNTATGYNNLRAAFTGNIISASMEERGETYEPNFRNSAKCIIGEIPSDILEVEEMPESFVGRNIDYSMPSGNPWRRGKIFMINWVAILSRNILGMLQPDDE